MCRPGSWAATEEEPQTGSGREIWEVEAGFAVYRWTDGPGGGQISSLSWDPGSDSFIVDLRSSVNKEGAKGSETL